jgi:tRNA synthetases class I (E and Q), catalytic domain/tRNA synthetases class I (E and Q), anti-codon binding domain
VLRAKIDMASPNITMRDPVLYRIRRAHHHRTGDAWCIYPMYDFAHPPSDAIELITHSLCTLEFEEHRPLYDWLIANLPVPGQPQQIEFARLNLSYTVMSKRKFLQLVERKLVDGWDDPRMPTIAGLRRRGFTPEAIRQFCDRIGVGKRDGVVDVALLEFILREDLNKRSDRAMAVLKPLRVVIENFPEGEVEWFEAQNHPEYPEHGTRKVPFSRVLYIEHDDFREVPPKKWFRLAPGAEVRLRYACLIRCRGARVALHLGSGLARRHTEGRAQSEGHAALGVGRARDPCGGAALRSLVLGREPERRRRPAACFESELARRAEGREAGACARERGGRQPLPVRAARVLLSRQPRLEAGDVGVEPDDRAAGQLGQDREQSEVGARKGWIY